MFHSAYLWLFITAFPPMTYSDETAGKVSPRNGRALPSLYLNLPVFAAPREPPVETRRFSPARGSGKESLPAEVLRVLFPPERPSVSLSTSRHPVKTWCWRNKIYAQVDRRLFNETQSKLLLGTCEASNSTRFYFYFEYDFGLCGTKRQVTGYQVTFSNTLQYNPPKTDRQIRRAVPFSLPVACYYKRFLYSYKIGYKPKVHMQQIYKPMKRKAKFILTARNDQWERVFPSDQYLLGHSMYFEAEAPFISSDERLYIHSCYVTPDKSHTSVPRLIVVNNFGCMVESKESRSRFIPYKNNIVRLTLDAFLFKGMEDQQLYMHCNMSVASSLPSPTAKSCNYDAKAQRWLELYGSVSVCYCCDYSCGSTATENQTTRTISSKPWKIQPEIKTTKTPKKRTTLIKNASTAATYSEKGKVTSKPEGRVTPKPEGRVTPKPEGRVTPKPEGRVTPKPEGRVTPKPEGRVTPKAEGRVTPKPEGRVTPKPEGRVTPKAEGRVTPKPEGRVTPKPEGRVTPKPEGRVTPKPEGRVTSKPEGRVTSMPKGRADITNGKLENMVNRRGWPFSGGQVTWVTLESEKKHMNGSIVEEEQVESSAGKGEVKNISVEQEEEEEEVAVTPPRLIFEEIFDFGK